MFVLWKLVLGECYSKPQNGTQIYIMETENFKIGDLVIFKDQSKCGIDNALAGGIINMQTDTVLLVKRPLSGIRSYKKEEMRLLKPEDLDRPDIEIV